MKDSEINPLGQNIVRGMTSATFESNGIITQSLFLIVPVFHVLNSVPVYSEYTLIFGVVIGQITIYFRTRRA
jgi:hypothetical protein